MKINYVKHNNKSFHHAGRTWRITAHGLGNRQVVSVLCVSDPLQSIDDLMKSRTKLALAIKNRIRLGLVG